MNWEIKVISNGFLVKLDKPQGLWFTMETGIDHSLCQDQRSVYCKTQDEVRELLNSALTEFLEKHQPDVKKS